MVLVAKRLGVLMAVAIVTAALLSAQQQRARGEPARIGYIGLRPLAESAASMEPITALKDGLRELGLTEGTDYILEIRIANNAPDRYPALTRELAQLGVKLIVAASTPAAVAIHQADSAMPIVVRGPDLVGAGLATSVGRPGGVVTGIDELAPGLTETRLRLLKEALPRASRIAVLSSAPTENGHLVAFAEAEHAAGAIGLSVKPFRVSATTDYAAVFSQLRQDGADAIFLSGGVLPRPVLQEIVRLAASDGLPGMYASRDYVELGGLMSYAYRNADIFRAAAGYVDRILKGAKPGDLPITMWNRHYLTVNAKAATGLGLTLPALFLSKANEILK
jgi:putative tryptophan/tyrosine transport system substrate-binding protein